MTKRPPRRHRREMASRSIHFFRLDAGAEESGVPAMVDLRSALKRVDELPFERSGGRYLARGDARLCMWIESVGRVCRLRFASIRDNALPQVEAKGQLSDLDVAEDAGLCETSHICIFPEGIVGVEFNFYGPRANRFADYVRSLAPDDCPEFVMEALLRQDIAAELERKKAVRALTLRVRRSYIGIVAEANRSLGDAFNAAERASNAECVGIYLEPEPYQRHDLSDSVFGFIKQMVRRSDLHENIREFKVKVVDRETDRATDLDLLRDQLISEKKIFKQHGRTRVLDRDDAYGKIEDAFNERREELLSAASVNLVQ